MVGKHKLIAILLSANFIFPVSCSFGLYSGVHILSACDARDIQSGEMPHPGFSIIVKDSSKKANKLETITLKEQKANPNRYQYLLTNMSGTIGNNKNYKVESSTNDYQIIELHCYTDDMLIVSKYLAKASVISPLYSKIMYHGYMFNVFPYAIVFAIFIMFLAKSLKRKLLNKHIGD
ncbi:MAG: hypothetical protein D6B27_00565 [Gammaproteobacteria bacterium]|nr:MAG: hypothetical protein D6B27_00565 [Gammaproteobacteria bacterium]